MIAAALDFARAAAAHPEVAGVLLYGSALTRDDPADLDFVVLLDRAEPVHFYGVHQRDGLRCEVEYLSPPALDEYFDHPHWRTANWELDLGAKYIAGRRLYDPVGQLAAFRARLLGPAARRPRRYLFVHHLGQAYSRLLKLRRPAAGPEAGPALAADFAGALDRAAHHARLTFPAAPFGLSGWPWTETEQAGLLAAGAAEFKTAWLDRITAHGCAALGLDSLLADCRTAGEALERLPIFHLVDYAGLGRVLAHLRPDLPLPDDVMMPYFKNSL